MSSGDYNVPEPHRSLLIEILGDLIEGAPHCMTSDVRPVELALAYVTGKRLPTPSTHPCFLGGRVCGDDSYGRCRDCPFGGLERTAAPSGEEP